MFGNKYMKFRIICSLQYSININTVEADPHSHSLHNNTLNFINLLTIGRRGVPYLGHINLNMYQGTRKRSPQLTKYFTKQNLGTSQWMKIAEKKRKEQRAALKFEIMKYHSKLRLGFSARSNPARYLPDYDIEDSLLETEEASEIEKIESGITKK